MAIDRSVFPENDPGRSSFRKANQAYVLAIAGVVLCGISESVWPSAGLTSEALISAGILLVAIGLAGRIWVSVYQAGHKNKRLITDGPYSLCRNPMYFCNLLAGVGACLTTATITVPALFVGAYVFHYRRVIRDEEARLRRHHGAAFDAYCARTPLFVPSLKGFTEPFEYLVRTRDLSEKIPIALWPIATVPVILFVGALHAHNVLPMLIRIY